MSEHVPSTPSLGEGFAFFRWHALRWKLDHWMTPCNGFHEPTNDCCRIWKRVSYVGR